MRAYERLLKYVKVHTTSDPNSGTHPSTLRQFDLAKILVEELKELGLTDAHVDEHCYVYATLPATPGQESAAPLGLIAHMDTADDASGENVRPQIHENYDGEAVTLPATGTVLDPKVFPFLREMKGQTLITTDGSTLLGADDKAGVAEIMTALERIIAENRPHGKLCIGFTPDEEIGEGASLFDVEPGTFLRRTPRQGRRSFRPAPGSGRSPGSLRAALHRRISPVRTPPPVLPRPPRSRTPASSSANGPRSSSASKLSKPPMQGSCSTPAPRPTTASSSRSRSPRARPLPSRCSDAPTRSRWSCRQSVRSSVVVPSTMSWMGVARRLLNMRSILHLHGLRYLRTRNPCLKAHQHGHISPYL